MDLKRLVNDAKLNNVIEDAPRVQNNIVTLRLIIKIQKWVKGICYKKKTLF